MCLISDFLGRMGYRILEVLDKSSRGCVYKAQHIKTKAFVAIKTLPKINNEKFGNIDSSHEIYIMKMLDHPLAVDYYESFSDEERFYVVMEYLPRGSLFDYIVSHGKLSESISNNIFTQLVTSLSYLHKDLRVIHRDIKAENVLLDQNFNIRLIDFGLSCHFTHNEYNFDYSVGSIGYLAPELVNHIPYDDKVDIWSLGVLLYALVTGCLPFEGRNHEEIKRNIVHSRLDIPDYISASCRDLLSRMLDRNAKTRISLDDIIHHPWFSLNQYNAIRAYSNRVSTSQLLSQPDSSILHDVESLGIKTENIFVSLFMKDCTEATTAFRILRRLRISSEMLF